MPRTKQLLPTADETHAELVLRWLRANAQLLFDAERDGTALRSDHGEFGRLAAQLLDFADLLDQVEELGQVERRRLRDGVV